MSQFTTLPGFREFYPEDCALRNYIFDTVRQTAASFGFEEYDAPILEPVELFTAKSGDEIVSQLFNFKDKGERHIALRPEMTPSLSRMVGAKAASMKRPIKWFNISESFRYERPQKGRLRSFYQMNVDIFGDDTFSADAEIISFGISAFQRFGLTSKDFHVRLSDRILWSMFLENIGIPTEKVHEVLCVIDKIDKESPATIVASLNKLCENGKYIFDEIISLKNIKSANELREKFSNATETIYNRISELENLLKRLEMFGLKDFITLDFGIVRGLAYYTGFVFEFFERSGESRALAGGGRYDNLVKKLGYNDLHAAGFAIGDVTLGNLLKEKNLVPNFSKKIDCFVVYQEETAQIAFHDIQNLRLSNISIDYCFTSQSFSKQLKSADTNNAKFAIVYGNDELASDKVVVKDLKQRTENQISRASLSDYLKNLLKK